jgi:hypothetical protein
MATKRSVAIKITKGGGKTRPWVRFFIPGDGHPLQPRSTVRAAKSVARAVGKLRGATDTIIPNPANPPAGIIAQDVAVRVGGVPVVAPTVAGGSASAPAAAAVVADSGPMPAGTYRVGVVLSISGMNAPGKQMQIEHRNAANAATNSLLGACPAGGAIDIVRERVTLALNERIRVVVAAVALAASEVAVAEARLYLLPL